MLKIWWSFIDTTKSVRCYNVLCKRCMFVAAYTVPLLMFILCWSGVCIDLLNTTGHVMHQQFKIQQLYILPTLYLCVLYLSENKQRLVPLTA